MSIVVAGAVRCGKPGVRGPCQHRIRNGYCPIHNNLETLRDEMRRRGQNGGRTRASQFDTAFQQNARSHVKTESLKKAGRAGYNKVGGDAWWAEQTEKARQYRLRHPSPGEKIVAALLTNWLPIDVHFDREVIVDADPRAVDFAIMGHNLYIEVTDSAARASFGRNDKREEKRIWLEGLGWTGHYFYNENDLETEKQQLAAFLKHHNVFDAR